MANFTAKPRNMEPKIQVLGIPFDDKSCFMRGPALAPDKIRKTLHNGASNFTAENGIDIFEDIELLDRGDIHVDFFEEIYPSLKKLVTKDKILFLGGDHSITFPIIQLMKELHGEFDILHFDAHPDLYQEYMGDPHSHACPFARIMENNLCNRLISVGIRTLNKHQQEQAKRFGVELICMNEIEKMNQLKFKNPLYISFDMDAIDPAFAPGVSHHEAGGLTSREVINFINKIKVPIIGADIVELNPKRDNGITAALATKLMKEFLAKMATT